MAEPDSPRRSPMRAAPEEIDFSSHWRDGPAQGTPWSEADADDVSWYGRAAVRQAQRAEKDVAMVRLFIVVFNVLVYAIFLPRSVGSPTLAAVITVVALSYSVVVVVFEPYRRFPALATSTFTVATDSVLIILWLHATGGPVSPFYPLWLASLFAVAFRFGPKMAALAAGVYIVGDMLVYVMAGTLVSEFVPALVRAAYIAFGGMLGYLLGEQVERAFTTRVRMQSQIREQRRLAEDQQRFQVLAEAAMEGLLIHERGTIVECNQEAARLLGHSAEALVGVHVADLVHPDSWVDVERRLQDPSDESYEVWIKRGDGAKRLFQVKARDLDYRGHPMRVTGIRDITEEREAEEAKLRSIEQEQEIQRLQDMDRFKTQFINTAAHELNTPLTPLKLQLHILRMGLKEHPKALDILERNLDRLSNLVGDMLDVARLESGRLSVEEEDLDLRGVIREAAETYRPVAQKKGVRLTVDAPEAVVAVGDPRRVRQVLDNLITNATKFTDKEGEVRIKATHDGGRCIVRVEDDGVGMDEDQLARLFQPFTQVHEPRPDRPGTGLGLFICSKLLEVMGGDISAESPGPGKGSTFTFTLPRPA